MLEAPSAPSASRQLQTLVIEPNVETRQLLELALTVRGQAVTTCATGADAARALASGAFPLVIVNRLLPDDDALEVCRRLRATTGATIVMLSSIATDADRDDALAAGVDEYISWPAGTETLRAQLETAERRALAPRPAPTPAAAHNSFRGDASEPFLLLAPDGVVRRAAAVSEQLLGFPADAIAGINGFSFFHPDDAPALLSILGEALARPGLSRPVEVRVRRDGDLGRTVSISAENQLADAERPGIALVLRGPDARVDSADQITRATLHDRVTDLPNRTLFLDRVQHALARAVRRGTPVVVITLDLNDLTDEYGSRREPHDGLIVAVAQRLRSCLRMSDTAARIGPDEFALLLEEIADPDHVRAVAERILQSLRLPFYDGGEEVALWPNIGIVASDADRRRAADLIRDADIARSWARVEGAGRFILFDEGMRALDDEHGTGELVLPSPEIEIAAAAASAVQAAGLAAEPPVAIEARFDALQDRLARVEELLLRLERG